MRDIFAILAGLLSVAGDFEVKDFISTSDHKKYVKSLKKKYRLSLNNYCDGCSNEVEILKDCPCRKARYCSEECQRDHWPTHKQVCPCRN
jgi:hypothetical protein